MTFNQMKATIDQLGYTAGVDYQIDRDSITHLTVNQSTKKELEKSLTHEWVIVQTKEDLKNDQYIHLYDGIFLSFAKNISFFS
jgi:hypothetical protein